MFFIFVNLIFWKYNNNMSVYVFILVRAALGNDATTTAKIIKYLFS